MSLGIKGLQVGLRPFWTVEDLFVSRFVAQSPPRGRDLVYQFTAAVLHAEGELCSGNHLLLRCHHFVVVVEWNLSDQAGTSPSTKVQMGRKTSSLAAVL